MTCDDALVRALPDFRDYGHSLSFAVTDKVAPGLENAKAAPGDGYGSSRSGPDIG
jgi:hypothetical protein